ncbi:MAG: hypothetical protein ACRD4V_00845, partial [Candidatus Acidiferrales bacterium]
PTPEARIAAVARSLVISMGAKFRAAGGIGTGGEPDYADFRAALAPYVKLEIVKARIDEARLSAGRHLTSRVRELSGELAEIEKTIPKELGQ